MSGLSKNNKEKNMQYNINNKTKLSSEFRGVIILYTILALILGGLYITYRMYMSNMIFPAQRASAQTTDCPAGSYSIGIEKNGEHICKLEPTGCPFGDSIPLDSPKCVPPADIECNADFTVCNPINETSSAQKDGLTPVDAHEEQIESPGYAQPTANGGCK